MFKFSRLFQVGSAKRSGSDSSKEFQPMHRENCHRRLVDGLVGSRIIGEATSARPTPAASSATAMRKRTERRERRGGDRGRRRRDRRRGRRWMTIYTAEEEDKRQGSTRRRIRRRRGNSCSKEATSIPCSTRRKKRRTRQRGREGKDSALAPDREGAAYKARRVTRIEP